MQLTVTDIAAMYIYFEKLQVSRRNEAMKSILAFRLAGLNVGRGRIPVTPKAVRWFVPITFHMRNRGARAWYIQKLEANASFYLGNIALNYICQEFPLRETRYHIFLSLIIVTASVTPTIV